MPELLRVLAANGGVAHTSRLRAAGIPDHLPRRAAAHGVVLRVRPGVYALPAANAEVVRAARVGGRLAGASAAAFHDLWTVPRHPLVVEVGFSASHLRDPDDSNRALDPARRDVRVLWAAQRRGFSDAFGVSPLTETLRQVVLSESVEFAVAILDTALRTGSATWFDLEELKLTLPVTQRAVVSRADGIPESGTESVLRVALGRVGIAVAPQVRMPLTNFNHLDFLVGDRLVIEVQSRKHHGSQHQRLKDLRRHADLAAMGFIVLEFDYWQIIDDLELVVATVLSYVDRGLHLSPTQWPRPS